MNYQAYREWLKLRQEGKVEPAKNNISSLIKDDRGSAADSQRSMRNGCA
jgi:hypothetical protein